MKGAIVAVLSAVLLLSLIPTYNSFAEKPDNVGKPEVIAVTGITPDKKLIVHILVLVEPGADRNEAAAAALSQQGARPFTAEEFSTIDLFWDQFSDGNPGNDFVTQNYNPADDPTGGQGITALLNTHASWNGVQSSIFELAYGGETTRCPSLVKECKGPQEFDGNNDVAWMKIRDRNTLGVTWSGTSIDEADMALNTNFNWATDGVNDFDVETVYLHENGHVAGLGHSDDITAIMYASYQDANRVLQQDDIDGITFLYPLPAEGDPPVVTITSPTATTFALGEEISFAATATDTEDGDVSGSLVWVSDVDGQIGTGASFTTSTLSNAIHTITATAIDSDSNSASDSVTITVGEITTPTESIAQPIVYDLAGGKNSDKHLLITIHVVDDLGSDVANADVSISISREGSVVGWSGSGTTGTDGKVTFQLSNARSGCYSTTVDSITADPAWNGVQPADPGFCKP